MDAFEKELAKKQLEVLKSINRNINFLGRKLEMTNNILGKYGIAILPGAEEIKEQEKSTEDEAVVRVSDIQEWAVLNINKCYQKDGSVKFADVLNGMLHDLEKDGKFIQ